MSKFIDKELESEALGALMPLGDKATGCRGWRAALENVGEGEVRQAMSQFEKASRAGDDNARAEFRSRILAAAAAKGVGAFKG